MKLKGGMIMLKKYYPPEIEIIEFQSTFDVLFLSKGDEETPWNPGWDEWL